MNPARCAGVFLFSRSVVVFLLMFIVVFFVLCFLCCVMLCCVVLCCVCCVCLCVFVCVCVCLFCCIVVLCVVCCVLCVECCVVCVVCGCVCSTIKAHLKYGVFFGSWVGPRPPVNKENHRKQDGQTLSKTNNNKLTSNRCHLSRENCELYRFRIVRIFLGSWVLLLQHHDTEGRGGKLHHPTGGGERSTAQWETQHHNKGRGKAAPPNFLNSIVLGCFFPPSPSVGGESSTTLFFKTK